MRVLVTWADRSSTNLGVRALAEGVGDIARRAWGATTQVDYQGFGPAADGIAFGGKSVLRDLLLRDTITRKVATYDVILDIGGGDSFTDIYGLKRLAWISYSQRAATRQGSRVVLGPQTIGPFTTRVGRALARRNLRSADLVIARDPVSLETARSLGAAERQVVEATDAVFALPQESARQQCDVLFNVSGLLWKPNPHVDHDEYRANVVAVIRELLDEGRAVTLFPHVLRNPTQDDDVSVLDDVEAAVGRRIGRREPRDLADARAVISGSKVLVGARMHAVLNALSQGVPAVPWAYSRKFGPLMGAIGWPHTVDLRAENNYVQRTMALIRNFQSANDALAVRENGQRRVERTVEALRSLRGGTE